MRLSLAIIVMIVSLFGIAAPTRAHEIRPAIVTVAMMPEQRFEITVSANLEALLAEIGTQHKDTDQSPAAARYNALRALPPDGLRSQFDAFKESWLDNITLQFGGTRVRPNVTRIDIPPVGDIALARISNITLSGKMPPGAASFQWAYAAKFGNAVLRVKRLGDKDLATSWLKDGAMSAAIPLQGTLAAKSTATLLLDYIVLGFTHILPKGLDHILFVLGLYLLCDSWRPLLVQVTAFTIAHSITLGLGLYGVINISPSIVEPLIAISIVYVAVENIMTSKLSPWRPFVVFAFGLLHGLGFAGVLQEIGLPRADFVTGLIGFNVGVELGQLSVIALAFLATGLWFGAKPWYRQRIVMPASAVIALIGLYWTYERVFMA